MTHPEQTPRTNDFARSGDASAEDWTDFASQLECKLSAANARIAALESELGISNGALTLAAMDYPARIATLEAKYKELRELAMAVLSEMWDANVETPSCKALRGALGDKDE